MHLQSQGLTSLDPVYRKVKKSTTGKTYIALFTCASTRAVHLKLCRDLPALEFQRVLKEFVAWRGCPHTIVSDKGKTFVATGKWLSVLKKDQSLANFMEAMEMKWKCNLARAPWWGGFFERLIGIMKRTLSKVIGRSLLTFQELEEALLDVETSMNNRPLLYRGKELEKFGQPVITPNILLREANSHPVGGSGEDWGRDRGNQASEVLAEKQRTLEEVHERIRSCSRRNTTEVN